MLHIFSQLNPANEMAAEAADILGEAENMNFEQIHRDLQLQIQEGGSDLVTPEIAKQLDEEGFYQPFYYIREGDGRVRINLKLAKDPISIPKNELPSTIHVYVSDPGEFSLNEEPFKAPIDFS